MMTANELCEVFSVERKGHRTALQLEHGIHLMGIHKGLHHCRHAAYHRILQQQLTELFVQRFHYGHFGFQAFGQILDHRRFDTVCPQIFKRVSEIGSLLMKKPLPQKRRMGYS